MRLYRTAQGALVEREGELYALPGGDWDELLNREGLHGWLSHELTTQAPAAGGERPGAEVLAPIGRQEVWAAGVTYFRSRTARMEESRETGGGSFYDRVYEAERPELFFKATPTRVVGPGGEVRIRRDSAWNVPEPELTLVVNARGEIVGYTVGNDMSSRDIEGENPLYLPQAKCYDGSCALGPGILLAAEPLAAPLEIGMEIRRGSEVAFRGETSTAQMKRSPEELVEYLFRETSFPDGCFLMTGTGIVPPDTFTLSPGDEIRITIEPIGTLVNRVAGG